MKNGVDSIPWSIKLSVQSTMFTQVQLLYVSLIFSSFRTLQDIRQGTEIDDWLWSARPSSERSVFA